MKQLTIFILRTLTYLNISALLLSFSLSAQAAVVLQYHHIDTNTPFSTSTDPALFKQHIEYLVNNGFNVVSLPALIEGLNNQEVNHDKSVAITFDDGFISIYTHAYPTLKAHNLPFTIFVNTDPIQAKRPTHLSWDHLREMKQHGATIANHTHRHSYLINPDRLTSVKNEINSHQNSNDVSESNWKSAFIEEIETTQKLLKTELNQDIKLFAYPYGEFDQQTNTLLAEMGYIGFGQHSGAIRAGMDMQSLPRYPASNQYGKFPLFATKLNTIAFDETTHFTPNYGVIDESSENPPSLYISGSEALLNSINCFGSSVGALPKVKINNTTLMITPEQPFTSRRFRYNCTAKSHETGHFRWVSIPWVNLGVDAK